jgi:tetratricopeptide (TPR) repeat protein
VALGHASLQAGRWEAAERAYREAVGLKVETADIDRALARALDQEGKAEEAIASLRRALALDPGASDSLSIARLLAKREEWLLAEGEILAYLRSFPASIEGTEILAFVLGRSGKASQAEAVYRSLERLAPSEPKYRMTHARLSASQGHYGEALDQLEIARHMGGLKDEDERLLADLYLQEKMFGEAADCYARRLGGSGANSDDAYRLGHAYFESGQWVSARNAFQKALELDPRNGNAAFYLGRVASAQGNLEEARKYYREALGLMSGSPQPALALGTLELKDTAWEKAAEAFEEALKRGSDESSVGYDLAYCRGRAGKKKEALQALKEALHQAPFDERLRGLLHDLEK